MSKSKIYTCTGDTGVTSLVGGKRVKKTDIRIEAYGSVDELNSNLGVLIAIPNLHPQYVDLLRFVQNKLFNIGAYLATPNPDNQITHCQGLTAESITRLEDAIDEIDAQLPPLNNFVLPGGSHRAAVAHVCRTMCRRCERRIVALADTTYVDPKVLEFVNRLSDFLFVFARFNNVANQVDEIFWEKEC
ncbi:MAG: cob(I)yrinic acid a,c-diamide adenosyltransferase [Muribaculum sp.]|nr:cob(I)yrinic acid a,c-diamide adenosyltransferase [Muribaculum sp.]